MKPHKSLPEPTPELQQRSAQLTQKIRQHLQRAGEMRFSEYMQRTLYTPGLGYYASGLPKIGATGDFITAPEVSPLFSQCLANQSQQVLERMEGEKHILEFGAGRGVMAKDILRHFQQNDWALDRYFIIELSADLQARQKTLLEEALPPEWFAKISWLDRLPERPINGVVLANEVLDAMPFERLFFEPEEVSLAYVSFNEEKQKFEWDYRPITDAKLRKQANALIPYIGKLSHLGYKTEINLHIQPWLKSLEKMLNQGAVLLIDYGYVRQEYYQPARTMGTLRCHYQHRAHSDPFFYPGLQDITAHVDFTAVAEAGFDAGFKVAGFTTQAHFLMGSGLLQANPSADADVTEQLKFAQQVKTLTLPDEMGETFKVIALTKNFDQPLMGFALRDLRHTL
jgi:SAM-dependent MidA family methyltransferase